MSLRLRIATACALSLLVLGAPARAAQVVERVVAVVNDDIILESELEQWAAPMAKSAPDLDSADGRKAWEEIKRKALDSLIDLKLEQQQATELKLTVTSEEVDRAMDVVREQNKMDETSFRDALRQQGFSMDSYRKTLKQQILQMKVLNTAVRARVNVSDEEVKTSYNQNARQLGGDRLARLRWILCAAPAENDELLRKKAVCAKVVELARKGTSFVELAKKYSDDDTTKAEGGDLGFVGRGGLEDSVDNAVAAMEAGDVRGPVRVGRGWAALQLVERKQGAVRPFEEVKDQLRKQLYDEQVDKATQAWLREMRKKAHIDIRL